MKRWLMTVRVITEHKFIVEADDELEAHACAYDEVHNDLDRDEHVEIHAQEITP